MYVFKGFCPVGPHVSRQDPFLVSLYSRMFGMWVNAFDAWNLPSQVFLLLSCIIPCKFRHLSTLTLPLLLEIMPPCFVLRCTLYLHNSDKDFSWGCSESLLLCRLSVVVASGSYSSLQCVGSSCGGLPCWGAQALGTGAQ